LYRRVIYICSGGSLGGLEGIPLTEYCKTRGENISTSGWKGMEVGWREEGERE
jgi:hypothetical protein